MKIYRLWNFSFFFFFFFWLRNGLSLLHPKGSLRKNSKKEKMRKRKINEKFKHIKVYYQILIKYGSTVKPASDGMQKNLNRLSKVILKNALGLGFNHYR